MTLTLNKKLLLLGIISAFMVSGVAADYYYNDGGSNSITQDTGFSVPQFESQQELVSELVAPFIFVSILLQILFNRALRFAFVDEDRENRTLLDLLEHNRPPSVKRESTVMALAATAILVPTPFWGYVRWAAASIGVISVTLVAAGVIYLFYLFLRG